MISLSIAFPDAKAQVEQILFRPTYMCNLIGYPPEDALRKTLTRWAEDLWGKRDNLRLLMGKNTAHERTGRPIFPPLAVFVELTGDVIQESNPDKWDTLSVAYLVFLTHPEDGIEAGVSRFVQRLVDHAELRWADVAVNASP